LTPGNVLFYEELDEQHGYLIDMGLEVRELDDRMVARVFDLAGQYKRPGRYDLFALVLAAEENCPLLTGDKDLKAAAENEHVEVRGTLWLVEEMVRAGKISVQIARNAYQRMQVHGRRLPWKEAEDRLALLDKWSVQIQSQTDETRTSRCAGPSREFGDRGLPELMLRAWLLPT
jgi:predicted nucleic acid-binding protein